MLIPVEIQSKELRYVPVTDVLSLQRRNRHLNLKFNVNATTSIHKSSLLRSRAVRQIQRQLFRCRIFQTFNSDAR